MSKQWNRLNACVTYRWTYDPAPTNTDLVATNRRRLITRLVNGGVCLGLLLIAGVVFR